jgi:hypothetical protein
MSQTPKVWVVLCTYIVAKNNTRRRSIHSSAAVFGNQEAAGKFETHIRSLGYQNTLMVERELYMSFDP